MVIVCSHASHRHNHGTPAATPTVICRAYLHRSENLYTRLVRRLLVRGHRGGDAAICAFNTLSRAHTHKPRAEPLLSLTPRTHTNKPAHHSTRESIRAAYQARCGSLENLAHTERNGTCAQLIVSTQPTHRQPKTTTNLLSPTIRVSINPPCFSSHTRPQANM